MTEDRKLISSGSPFEKQAGYSRAVVQTVPGGRWCFVAGTTGYDYTTMEMPEDVRQQTRNTIETIKSVLEAEGFSLSDIVRANYIITDISLKSDVFDVVGSYFRDVRPAATMIIAGLVEPTMKVEIEVTAWKADA
ncbi:MAG: RidA family protein [Pseudomonadota bacterium]